MSDDQREAIRANAKYLRHVRPIDPDEIAEYVEGYPHPGVVRRVLREEAFDLGLRERTDGTFVPASEGPIEPTFDGVEAFPEPYAAVLEELLVERHGPEWADGETGDRLRHVIRDLKEEYYRQRPVVYDEDAALGYACYHLPDYYAAIQYVLHELGTAGLLPATLRVLDVGAGVGGPALGLVDYLGDEALVDYHAVEPSAATTVLESLLAETGPNVHATVHSTTIEAFEPDGEYDLIIAANVLSELDDPVTTLERLLPSLSDDGALVTLAPADKHTSIGLREVERELVDAPSEYDVFSPTLRLWPGESPTDRGWSFDVKPDLAVPAFQRRLDEGRRAGPEERDPATGEFVNVDVQYSYAIIRRDGVRRVAFDPSPKRFAKLAETERHVTDRINVAAVKLSHSLSEAGANPVYKVGDGSESIDHYAVLTRETSLNSALRTADYGDVLVLERVLALWNDDEEAYNLVVDDETIVDAIPAGE